MGWLWAALMPHPPILIPEIGCGRQKNAEATLLGIKKIIDRLYGDGQQPPLIPDKLLVLSPHQPYASSMLYANTASAMSGSFGPFGAANVRLSMKNSSDTLSRLVRHIEQFLPVVQQSSEDLTRDHGSLVPLYFFHKAWQKLPEIYCFNPIGLSLQQAEKLGEILAQYDDGATWGFVASGDLSHRLTQDAPGGYDPAGKVFDKAVLGALMQGSTKPLLSLSAQEMHNAGECGCKSVCALLGLTGEPVEIMSYEGPFGVGYCTALAFLDKDWARVACKQSGGLSKNLPLLARLAITSYLSEKPLATEAIARTLEQMPKEERKLLDSPRACFVTIKNAHGELRGCIGTILPTRDSLLHEIMGNAIAAASQDPRFPALRPEEFDSITLSVDILGTPEPVQDITALDPQKYGVIVSKGNRRGLLLPALEGVDSVEKQLSIATQKGGITSLEGASIERFTVDRYYEVE